MRRLRPQHWALCAIVIGMAIALAIVGTGPWLVSALLLGCIVIIGLAVWLMIGDETTGRTERDRRDRR
ncbi:MAG: hypothetical protein IT431_07250 [Phycisphaerales bacterium]|nr:hypothetical protein [Phycisphaerales bacterium]